MNVFPVSPGSNPTNLAYFSEINKIDSKDKKYDEVPDWQLSAFTIIIWDLWDRFRNL